MTWQDFVIGTGQLLFSLALLPTLLNPYEKPPRSTCALTSAVLFLFAVTFLTLQLWWGAAMAALCATCWFVLLLQPRLKLKRTPQKRRSR